MYLGYDNNMLKPVDEFDRNAFFSPSRGTHGAYVLHTPTEYNTMKQLKLVANGRLERTEDGGSSFRFIAGQRQS